MKIGIPSSKLKGINFEIATDEGEAIAIAAGYYLATGKVGKVYMDSNGFANALEPLTSLCVPYKIPVELVIARRGDKPWHAEMNKHIKKILKLIKYADRTSFK